MEQERRKAMDALQKRYRTGRLGFGRLPANLRYLRKRWMWNAVVGSSRVLKRGMDICGALFGLFACSPVFIATALCILLEDGGPVFYGHTRVGKYGRHFTMYKFRSMVKGAEKLKQDLAGQNESEGGVIFKMRHDPRITRVGRIIRKFSIDELPQFYNVLVGDMSLVGPRPPVPSEVSAYNFDDRVRLEITPGITCLWQIGGRSELTFQEQLELDRRYIESRSLKQDIIILLKTVPAVLSGRGSY